MPCYKTHLIAGGTTAALLFVLLPRFGLPVNLETSPLLFLCTLIGSLFPDIDTTSKIQRLLFIVLAISTLVAICYHHTTWLFLTATITALIPALYHRTITHNIWFLTALPALLLLYLVHQQPDCLLVGITYYIFFVSGCLSHVFLDKITTSFKKIFK